MGKVIVVFVGLVSVVTFLVFGVPMLKGKEELEKKAIECLDKLDPAEQEQCRKELDAKARGEKAKVDVLTNIIDGATGSSSAKPQE